MAIWQKLSLTVYIWQLGKGIGKSCSCLHAAYRPRKQSLLLACILPIVFFFSFFQVRNNKLLEIELFFT